jgi:uncharacterized protein (TIGR03089 family)
MHPVQALQVRVNRDPASPLLTHVDAGAGTRIELSGVTFANNVAKTANLLRDEVGLDSGDAVVIDLPAHWQCAVWAVAVWSVNARLTFDRGPARVLITSDANASTEGVDEAFITALHPLGAPWPGATPPGMSDWSVAMRTHGDVFAAESLEDVAVVEDQRITAGARVLLADPTNSQLIDVLGTVLVAGASLVLLTNTGESTDALTQVADEGIDVVLS